MFETTNQVVSCIIMSTQLGDFGTSRFIDFLESSWMEADTKHAGNMSMILLGVITPRIWAFLAVWAIIWSRKFQFWAHPASSLNGNKSGNKGCLQHKFASLAQTSYQDGWLWKKNRVKQKNINSFEELLLAVLWPDCFSISAGSKNVHCAAVSICSIPRWYGGKHKSNQRILWYLVL